jgi:glucuronosyltransferase
MKARDTAVYWVEYVIRHRGAAHLRYPGADLNFWQHNSIDVVLFLLTVAYIAFKIFIFIVKFLISKVCKTEKPETKKKKN